MGLETEDHKCFVLIKNAISKGVAVQSLNDTNRKYIIKSFKLVNLKDSVLMIVEFVIEKSAGDQYFVGEFVCTHFNPLKYTPTSINQCNETFSKDFKPANPLDLFKLKMAWNAFVSATLEKENEHDTHLS